MALVRAFFDGFERLAGIPQDDPGLRTDLLDTAMLRPLGVLTASMGFLMMSAAAVWFTRAHWAAVWLSIDILLLTARFVPALRAWRSQRRVPRRTACAILLAACAMFATFGLGCAASFLTGLEELRIASALATMGLLAGLATRWAALPRLATAMIVVVSAPMAVAIGLLSGFLAALFLVLVVGTAVLTLQNNKTLLALLAAERRALRLAETDVLTGLLNRSGLEAALDRHAGRAVSLLFLDMDRFKAVNDRYGHAAGDEVLVAIAGRLRLIFGTQPIARLGGDEFVAILFGDEAELVDQVVTAVCDAVAQPVRICGQQIAVGVGVSIGVASGMLAAGETAALLAGADAALYEAKRARAKADHPGGRRRARAAAIG
ncbi:diguanylate cyclase [Sphingomonas sp. CLY1604]|uniref:diguanylate cyclase n=1 Tax=Sphingomonas sp. CLY1604 TaxID=3457786 RepID=UPI003FD72711